jgi:hypothetical protein
MKLKSFTQQDGRRVTSHPILTFEFQINPSFSTWESEGGWLLAADLAVVAQAFSWASAVSTWVKLDDHTFTHRPIVVQKSFKYIGEAW